MNSDQANALRFQGNEDNYYEIYFLTLNHLESSSGFWIRYELYVPRSAPERTYLGVWLTRFDGNRPEENFGIYEVFPRSALAAAAAPFALAIGDNELRNGLCRGELRGAGHHARWDLRFPPQSTPFLHYPESVYTAGKAVAGILHAHFDSPFTGTIEVDGRELTFRGDPGMQGHTWGSKHAHHWLWAHCTHFSELGSALELICSPRKKDETSNEPGHFFCVLLDGKEHRLMSVYDDSTMESDSRPGYWHLRAEGETLRLEGEVRARLEDLVEAKYIDPDGEPIYCVNSEVADADFDVYLRDDRTSRWRLARQLRSRGTTHVEWGDWFEHEEVANKIVDVATGRPAAGGGS